MNRLGSALVASILVLLAVGCQQDAADNASVVTTSPAGQSTSPSSDAAATRQQALLRVMHAIPANATLDVYAENNRLFENLGYKTLTPYREIDAQRFEFRLRPAGMALGEPLASESASLGRGDYYTIFVLPGDDNAARLFVAEDEHAARDAARARVRVVQASREAGDVDIYVAGRLAPLLEGVDFHTISSFQEVEPVSGSLEIRPAKQPTAILTVPSVSLDAGRTYTVVIVGSIRTPPQLEAFVIEDRVLPVPTGQ